MVVCASFLLSEEMSQAIVQGLDRRITNHRNSRKWLCSDYFSSMIAALFIAPPITVNFQILF